MELDKSAKISLDEVKMNENADQQVVHSVAHVCLAILQKYKGIPGHDIILSRVPEGMEPHLTKMLWKKGYLTGLSINNLKLASLGEDALKLAMQGGNI